MSAEKIKQKGTDEMNEQKKKRGNERKSGENKGTKLK